MKIFLKNATIVTSEDMFEGHILINDGVIEKIYDAHHDVIGEDFEEYDLDGKFVLPGVIDAHVHFRTPGHEYKEDFFTGSRACARGGTTTVLDMPNNNPPVISVESLDSKRNLIKGNSIVNYGFFFGANPSNTEEIKKAKNIAGVKVYMGSSTGNLLVDSHSVIDKVFSALGTEILIAVHAENEAMLKENTEKFKEITGDTSIHSQIRPCECAHIATKEAVHIAKKYGNRLHICHMSCESELKEVKKFKDPEASNTELRLSCEVTPHHLFLNENDYDRLGNYGRMNPPLRHPEDNTALIKGLKDGSVDMVATDHAPHTKEEKEKDYWKAPSGIPGVETSLPLMLDLVNKGEINLKDVARLMAENPARLFNIQNKGLIKEGFDADLVVVDMDEVREVKDEDQLTKCGWSAFRGMKLQGLPIMTFVHGVKVFDIESGVIEEKVGKEVTFKPHN